MTTETADARPLRRAITAGHERINDAVTGAAQKLLAPADGSAPTKRTAGQWFNDALRDEWDGLDRIYRDLRLADLFTLLNALMGLGAIVLASQGKTRWAVELVVVGVIMDGVDGAVARLGKGNGPLGPVLDTLADAITFVATSTVVTFLFLKGSTPLRQTFWYLIPLAFYLVCGLMRLARFESLRDDGKVRKYFSGIPTPAAAITLLSFVLLGEGNQRLTWLRGWLLAAIAVYLGILMVSRVRFPKVRGWSAVGAMAILLGILLSVSNPDFQDVLATSLLVLMALYVLAGPFYVLARYGPTSRDAR